MAAPVPAGTLYIPGTSTSTLATNGLQNMFKRALRVVNGENSSRLWDIAREYFQEALNDANTQYLWTWTTETASDTTLVDGQQAYSTPTDLWAIREVQLIGQVGTNPENRTLVAVPYDQMLHVAPSQSVEGDPKIWATSDLWGDQQLLVYPIPGTSAVTNFKLRIIYHTRVAEPDWNNPAATIAAPKEFGDALVAYARYGLCLMVDGRENDRRWSHFLGLYNNKIKNLKGTEQKATRGHTQIMPASSFSFARGGSIRYRR